MTKGDRLVQRYYGKLGFGHGYGQRGSNIEEIEKIKSLGEEKHTSNGSNLMNF
jgi:hypothetical protein